MTTRAMTANTKADDRAKPGLQLWTKYRVRWNFLTKLCASVPADPEVIKKWLESRQPRVRPAGSLSIEQINDEVLASIERGEGETEQDYSMLAFQRHEERLVQRAGTVKAHIKDCSRQLSAQFVGHIKGERSFATRAINGVYVDPTTYWIDILRPDGTRVDRADGAYDKAIHVRGPRGEPLNALKRFEYVQPPVMLEFTLLVLGRSVSETDLHHLFMYGGTHGYAGERSDGEGRYEYELERLDSQE